MVIFAALVILLVSSGVITSQEARAQAADSALPTDDATARRTQSSSYMPLYDSLYIPPIDAPPPYSP